VSDASNSKAAPVPRPAHTSTPPTQPHAVPPAVFPAVPPALPQAEPRYTFRRAQRFEHAKEFAAAFAAKAGCVRGPLRFSSIPNSLGHPRLGLSVGRRCGNAVHRNALKRLLREAFRLEQYHLPANLDFVISPHPHTPLALTQYQTLLREAGTSLGQLWAKRAARASTPQQTAPTPSPPAPPASPLGNNAPR